MQHMLSSGAISPRECLFLALVTPNENWLSDPIEPSNGKEFFILILSLIAFGFCVLIVTFLLLVSVLIILALFIILGVLIITLLVLSPFLTTFLVVSVLALLVVLRHFQLLIFLLLARTATKQEAK